MDVSSTAASTASTKGKSGASGGKSDSAVSSDFETFLKMLTTQMENQDPLNPVESSDFAVQLATFSGVEQQVRTNELLTSLAAQFGTGSTAQLADWVGMEVRAEAEAFFSGDPITIVPPTNAEADSAQLVVTDTSGKVVQRLPLEVTGEPLAWTGVGEDGIPLADGLYSFHVDHSADGKSLGRTDVPVYARVVEAQIENGAVQLVLEGGSTVAADTVTALRP